MIFVRISCICLCTPWVVQPTAALVSLQSFSAWHQHRLLVELDDGSLRERTNNAIIAYGHGIVRRSDDQTVEINGHTDIDVEAWLFLE